MSGEAGNWTKGDVQIGLIGAGFIAQVAHLAALTELAGCSIAAIADNRERLRAEVATRHGIPVQREHADEVLRAPGIDAFVVAMPRRAMGPAVAAALATGKPVLAEKPIAHTLEQGRRLVAAAETSGSPFAVGFMKRHDQGVARFRAELSRLRDDGELGDIVHVAMRDYCATYATPIPHHLRSDTPRPYRHPEWPTAPDWLPTAQRADYEVTINVASHDINLLRHVFGNELKPLVMRVRRQGIQLATLDAGSFDIALELGRVDTGCWEQTIDVYFQRGFVQLRLPSPLARQETARVITVHGGSSRTWTPRPEQRIWAFKAQAAQFLDVVRGKAVPLASGADALADLQIVEDLGAPSCGVSDDCAAVRNQNDVQVVQEPRPMESRAAEPAAGRLAERRHERKDRRDRAGGSVAVPKVRNSCSSTPSSIPSSNIATSSTSPASPWACASTSAS